MCHESGKIKAKGHQGNSSFGNFSGGPWWTRVMADDRYLLSTVLESVNVGCSVIMMFCFLLLARYLCCRGSQRSIER